MNIKRKLRLIFSLASVLVCFGLSSTFVLADDMVDFSNMETQQETTLSAEDMKTYAGGKITMAQAKQLVEQYANAVAQYSNCNHDELEYLGEYFDYQTDAFVNFAKTVGDEKCGNYKSYDDVNIAETEEEGIDVSAILHFEKRDLKMILHVSLFDNLGTVPTSVEFSLPDNGDESIGAKMTSAAVNTLMGMGTVFAVLIFISLIISCFRVIPKITEAKQKRKANKTKSIHTEQVEARENTADVMPVNDNSELIAVIAAAIAASENTSTDSFVVRSIRRR
ncbi:OadG family protein [uncultured Eubacterium sp.]|uniref:OadG family protein n=1 Tax=uncultured Eubacterium sp. TaxID=165185 RepID=UPI0026740EC4|nr:OadG family protein [uncultured Eubacterium sp.]